MKKRIHPLVFAAFALFASTIAKAEDNHPAQVLVESAVSDILDVYKNESSRLNSEPEYLQAKIDELIVPYLDLKTMTRLIMGKFWRRADEEQQQQLVAQFTALLNKTFTGAVTEYKGETVTFQPFRPTNRDDRAEVRSTLKLGNGISVPVLYKLRNEEGWRIYDVEAFNISLVNMLRLAFSNEIERTGIDGLIQTLKERSR